jgi:hypothetical protein
MAQGPTKTRILNFATASPIGGMSMHRLAIASPLRTPETRMVRARGAEVEQELASQRTVTSR